jgi:hypothetical protein
MPASGELAAAKKASVNASSKASKMAAKVKAQVPGSTLHQFYAAKAAAYKQEAEAAAVYYKQLKKGG